jgi:dihydroorotase-like cyclic amidohydrolase
VDLIVRNARLADRSSGELIDIGVEQGRIVALEHALAGEAEVDRAT